MDTIRNPGEWVAEQAVHASRGLGALGRALRGSPAAAANPPQIRVIGMADLFEALRLGFEDLKGGRTDILAICVVYPLAGLAAVGLAADAALLPLLFPAAAGLALVGPALAVGLYEISRRRERGESTGWSDAFGVVASPSFGAMLALALANIALFLVWLATAQGIYAVTLGPAPPASAGAFLSDVLTTPAGWALILLGCGTGFLFAALVLATSLVAFPLLLDRNVGLARAVVASVTMARRNPGPVAAWGAIVAAGLILGSLPLFLGLVVVMPVLGHATWRLYRRAVA
jgi:uncharacterized membrane protein